MGMWVGVAGRGVSSFVPLSKHFVLLFFLLTTSLVVTVCIPTKCSLGFDNLQRTRMPASDDAR